MKRTLTVLFAGAALIALSASGAFAQVAPEVIDLKASGNGWAIFLGAGFSIALAAMGAGIGMGRAIGSALEGVSRNPAAAPRIMTMMILGLALIESLAIYALVVSIILLFVV